jgi:hypothetical protein
MKISWIHEHTELAGASLEKKIEIFHAKVWGWTIHIAELVANGGKSHAKTGDAAAAPDVTAVPASGFAVLQILLSYFEMIGIYVEGVENPKNRSRELFKKGFANVFPQISSMPADIAETFLNTLYETARCGLYHKLGTGVGFAITGEMDPVIAVSADGKEIILNPHTLPSCLGVHLREYCDKLRDAANTQLREGFEKCFDRDNPKP